MQVFQLEQPERRRRRRGGPLAVVAGVALLAIVGTTYAANITINTNNQVDFAQGIVQTVSCDADGITLTPTSSAPQDISSSPTATWYLDTLTISGVSDNCLDKVFILQVYDTNNTVMNIGQVATTPKDMTEIRFKLTSSGWIELEPGTTSAATTVNDWRVSGSWANNNNNPVSIEFWYTNGDATLLTGWPGSPAHTATAGIVSADLVYFTIETTA